jgi:Tol biopolymer transport system component
MNSWRIVACIAGLVFGGLAVPAPAQVENKHQAEMLLQEAKHRALVDGDLERAIELCKKIVSEHSDNRTVMAKALLQMGGCYEKLGQAEAQKAYQRLIKEFADQNEVANQARVRLAAMESDNGKSEVTIRKIWGARGTEKELQDENNPLYLLTWGRDSRPSPNGRYIAYTNWGPPSIAVYDLSTGESRDITDEGTWDNPPTGDEYGDFPIWSPDGRYVAYGWCIKGADSGDYPQAHNELRIVGLEDAKPRRVIYRTDNLEEDILPYDWSPDGKAILAITVPSEGSAKDKSAHMVLISVEDGSRCILKSFEKINWRTTHMLFSPDGRYIAYSIGRSRNDQKRDIFLLKTDGSGESIPLLTHPDDDQLLGWHPDGKRLLFATNRTGAKTMAFIEVHEGQSRGVLQIRHLEPGFQAMGLTRNGAYYYSRKIGENDVYTATLDLEADKVLVPPALVSARMDLRNNALCWSSDGKYLAYYVAPMWVPSPKGRLYGPGNIVIRSLGTGQERELILSPKFTDKGFGGGVNWAPDGRSLLIRGWIETGHHGIFRVNIDTGKLTPVVLTNPEPMSPNWQARPDPDQVKGDFILRGELSPDGNTLFYHRYLNDPDAPPEHMGTHTLTRLFARDLRTGQEREIFGNPDVLFRRFALSPDGQHVAIGVHTALQILPSAGGEPRELLKYEDEFKPERIVWTPDSRYLLIVKGEGRKSELWRIAVAGGRPERVADELPTDPGGWRGLRIHPDGRQIAFTSKSVQQELWVMENFLPEVKTEK